MMSSKTEPHICCPLYLLRTRPAAVTCSVMAWTESALKEVQEAMGPDISLPDAPGPWLQAHTPAVTRSRATSSTRDQWAQAASTRSHPVPCHCSQRGRALVSAAAGRLPRRVHSTGGVAVGTSCNSAFSCSKGLLLPRLELGREWHRTGHKSAPAVLSGGFGGQMPRCSPAEGASAAGASAVMTQHPCAEHRAGLTPAPAQPLLQLQCETSSRVGAGAPPGLEGSLL